MDTVKEGSRYLTICIGCMTDKGGDLRCRKCGFSESENERYELRIKPRTILKNQYLIGKVLGQGGFGITYLGLDLILNKKVAIKEFLPSSFATRRQNETTVVPFSRDLEQSFFKGLHSFLSEARSVAKFSRHINIVNVNNYFEQNNTGYMVMDYLEGEPVSRLMRKRGGRFSPDEALSIMFPILEALSEVHNMGIYHRDISPQNIVVTTNGVPVLIDFGAAKQIVGEESRSLDVVLKQGYSPLEQYTLTGKIGPWSDVYACGATLYHMITGKLPPPSINRVYSDDLVQPCDIEGLSISEELNDAILTSLAVRTTDRYQSVDEFKSALERKGYIGYRKLLDSFLRDKGISLDNRMTLDRYIIDHQLHYDEAKSIEETLRKELNLPPLDWASEYRESYKRHSKEYPDGIPQLFDEKFHETYVSARRVSHSEVLAIVKDVTGAKAAPGKKVSLAKAAAVAACIVIAIAVFFVAKPKTGIETVPADKTTVTPPASDKFGFINVWSKPPAEIYINGRFVGISPQSKIRVPAGEVVIRLLSKKNNIDETYTEFVEPSSTQASN